MPPTLFPWAPPLFEGGGFHVPPRSPFIISLEIFIYIYVVDKCVPSDLIFERQLSIFPQGVDCQFVKCTQNLKKQTSFWIL